MMKWLKKKKVIVPYIPQGKVGYIRKESAGRSYEFTVIFEEIGRIGSRSKIRILEVDVDRDCNKNKQQCLSWWGVGDWIGTDNVYWETDEQRVERLGNVTPTTYDMDEEDLKEEIQYTLTPHNFTEQ
jgi:hypothetical protein